MAVTITFVLSFVLFLVIPIAVIYSFFYLFRYIQNLSYRSALEKLIVLIISGILIIIGAILSIFGFASLILFLFLSFFLDSYFIGSEVIFSIVGFSLAIIGILVAFRYRMRRIKMSPPKEDYKNVDWLKSQYHGKGMGVRDIAIEQNVSMIEIEKALGLLESFSKED